jgi:hypothetical protein
MRIVRHPNIVELKAFYYSNGERVRLTIHPAPEPYLERYAKFIFPLER